MHIQLVYQTKLPIVTKQVAILADHSSVGRCQIKTPGVIESSLSLDLNFVSVITGDRDTIDTIADFSFSIRDRHLRLRCELTPPNTGNLNHRITMRYYEVRDEVYIVIKHLHESVEELL